MSVDPCSCGYRPRAADIIFIEDYEVTHVYCYNCGKEWVE